MILVFDFRSGESNMRLYGVALSVLGLFFVIQGSNMIDVGIAKFPPNVQMVINLVVPGVVFLGSGWLLVLFSSVLFFLGTVRKEIIEEIKKGRKG